MTKNTQSEINLAAWIQDCAIEYRKENPNDSTIDSEWAGTAYEGLTGAQQKDLSHSEFAEALQTALDDLANAD